MKIKEADRLQSITDYYFAKKLKFITDHEHKTGKNIINLGIGNPDLAPSEDFISALKLSVSSSSNHGYQNYRGTVELRDAMARWYQKIFNVSLSADKEILPLTGSKEGILHITMAFVNAGEHVLVPNPGYLAYSEITKIVGGKIQNYNLKEQDEWSIDVAEIEKLDLNKVKLMWLNSPHMPTGSSLDKKTFSHLIHLAKKYDFLICHDNPYGMLSNNKPISLFNFPEALEVGIEINSCWIHRILSH